MASETTSIIKAPVLRASILYTALTVLLGVSACGTVTQELSQQDAVTANVTIDIKSRLVESDDVDAAAVRVELKDGVVVLSGFVASDGEASEAIRIAEQGVGGYTVQSVLVVK